MAEAESGRYELGEDEIVVLVPEGHARNVRVEEQKGDMANAEIAVRVHRNRASKGIPVLGVIVK